MRNVAWLTLFVTLLVTDGALAANRTRFDRPTGNKRTLVTAARASVQWTVNIDCALTWEEIQSIYFTLGDPDGPVPCWLAVAGQSVDTILIIECEDRNAAYGDGINNVILSESFGCNYVVTRNVLAKTKTTQAVSGFWHLDRIDTRSLPLDQQYIYQRTGTGVTAIVLDTGCAAHNDYNSRVVDRTNFIGSGTTYDPNGHGSHVMGLLGGTTSGVAKNATLECWTVLDSEGYGTFGDIQLAVQELISRQISEPFPCVLSMSLAGSYYAPINTQLTTLINTYGVAVVVAAGNSGVNAIDFSPASTAAALTVGATYYTSGTTEGKAGYSNYGSIVDIFAPGSLLRGPSHTDPNAYVTKSGTSMSTPVTAGVVVLAMQQRLLSNLSIDGAAAMAAVKAMATQNKISGYPLLFSSFGAASVPQPPPPPPPPPAPSAAPMAPPQSSWLAPIIRPVAGDAAPLMIAFLSHPLVPAMLFLSCLVDW